MPRDSYEIRGGDLLLELAEWLESVDETAKNSMVIWHTHPSGSIGPSRGDLTHKLQGLTYMVVSITPGTDQYQTTLF
jgi:proteasome lid subunit RPN8/RPN11